MKGHTGTYHDTRTEGRKDEAILVGAAPTRRTFKTAFAYTLTYFIMVTYSPHQIQLTATTYPSECFLWWRDAPRWTPDVPQFVLRIENRYLSPYNTAYAVGTVLFIKPIINTKICSRAEINCGFSFVIDLSSCLSLLFSSFENKLTYKRI
jgi:hypothetical protein